MVLNSDPLKAKLDNCRIGRNCQTRFWCGFCNRLVDLEKRGLDAWTERFDHINNHFMGRHRLLKQSIRDWIPVDTNKPKGDASSHALEYSQNEDQSDSNSNGNSSDSAWEGDGDEGDGDEGDGDEGDGDKGDGDEGDGDGGAKRKRRKKDSGRNGLAKRKKG